MSQIGFDLDTGHGHQFQPVVVDPFQFIGHNFVYHVIDARCARVPA